MMRSSLMLLVAPLQMMVLKIIDLKIFSHNDQNFQNSKALKKKTIKKKNAAMNVAVPILCFLLF